MSDPSDAARKAIENRRLVEQADTKEAFQRAKLAEITRQNLLIKRKEAAIKTAQVAPPVQIRPRRGAAFKPKKTITDVANKLLKEANLPTPLEQREAIKTMGISAARQKFKPKNVTEIKARLGLAVVEPLIGGAEEATIGFGRQSALRPQTQQLRIIGAIATPTAADFVAGWLLAKTGVTKAGRKLLRKLDDYLSGVDDIFPKLTAKELEEVRQWEKMGHTPTSLRRSAQRNPDIITTIEEMAAFYEKNPAQFSAGASVIPEEVFIFNKVAYDFNMEPTELVNFIKKNPNLFADGTLLAAIIPTLSNADAALVLEGTTLFPPDLVDDTIERLREETWSEQTPTLDEEEDQVRIVIPDVKPDVIPDVVPDIIPDVIPTKQKQKLITEQLLEEAVLAEVITTPIVVLGKRGRDKRNKLNLRLFRGAKSMFKVTFFFTKSMSEVKTVEARSFVEAVNKAQRGRKARKKQPRLVDVVKVK